jgi:hypothetical protein
MTKGRLVVTVPDGSFYFTAGGFTYAHDGQPAQMLNGHLMAPFAELLKAVGCVAYRDATGGIYVFAGG